MRIFNKSKFQKLLKLLIIINTLFLFNYKPFLAQAKDIDSSNQVLDSQPEVEEFNPEEYFLDTGDYIKIVLEDLPELSGIFPIGPSGMLYLPELREVSVRGINLEELRILLNKKYSKYIIDPDVYLRIMVYRPVRVYIHGEVVRPGFYTISKEKPIYDDGASTIGSSSDLLGEMVPKNDFYAGDMEASTISKLEFPTVYDSLRSARGITSYSDLSKISIVRTHPNQKGNKITTQISLLSLFKEGDQSQNIRIYDDDVIEVKRSDEVISEQLVRRSNLNPDNFIVYIGGKVVSPGQTIIPKGAGLNQAIEMAGGKKLLTGKVEFLRFRSDGLIDKRKFNYNKNARLDSYKNPVLTDGDIINVEDSVFRSSTKVIKTVTDPFVGIYSIYKLFD